MILTPTRLAAGVWEGALRGAGPAPRLLVTLQGAALPPPTLTPDGPGAWAVRVPIPPDAIAEGMQTFVVADEATGEALASFALVAGEALAGDLRAEVDLLRAELDLLKRAFRRHCLDAEA